MKLDGCWTISLSACLSGKLVKKLIFCFWYRQSHGEIKLPLNLPKNLRGQFLQKNFILNGRKLLEIGWEIRVFLKLLEGKIP